MQLTSFLKRSRCRCYNTVLPEPCFEHECGAHTTELAIEDFKLAVRTQRLVRAFRVFGHCSASLDPLGSPPGKGTELSPITYGITEEDMERVIPVLDRNTTVMGYGSLAEEYSVAELMQRLDTSYCGSMDLIFHSIYFADVGVEYMHIQDRTQCDWIRTKVELSPQVRTTDHGCLYTLAKEEQRECLERLVRAQSLEDFLGNKFPDKR